MVFVRAASSHAVLAFRGAGLICSSSLGAGGSPDAGLELESSAANLIAKRAMVQCLTNR